MSKLQAVFCLLYGVAFAVGWSIFLRPQPESVQYAFLAGVLVVLAVALINKLLGSLRKTNVPTKSGCDHCDCA